MGGAKAEWQEERQNGRRTGRRERLKLLVQPKRKSLHLEGMTLPDLGNLTASVQGLWTQQGWAPPQLQAAPPGWQHCWSCLPLPYPPACSTAVLCVLQHKFPGPINIKRITNVTNKVRNIYGKQVIDSSLWNNICTRSPCCSEALTCLVCLYAWNQDLQAVKCVST